MPQFISLRSFDIWMKATIVKGLWGLLYFDRFWRLHQMNEIVPSSVSELRHAEDGAFFFFFRIYAAAF